MKSMNLASQREVPHRNSFFRSGSLLLIFLILFSSTVFGQQREVTGTVYDENGEALIGATIVIKGTMQGAATDMDGKFTIRCSNEDILVFSSIGYEDQEIPVGVQSVINVVMSLSVEAFEEVVVTAYGVQEKQSVVGAVAQVSGDKIKAVKMGGSMENTLQGKLPGLTVVMTDPTPGEESMGGYYAAAPIQMVIRGNSSMNGNTPLIIVDGVERPFSNIDPNDVASISILKDAATTAAYGVKGANGILIITTKRGRSGAVQLDFSSSTSVKYPTILPEYMNSYETMLLRNEAYKNDGMWDMLISDEELAHYRDQDLPYLYPDFDWMDYYFKPGLDQSYNLNARGGNDFVQYYVSVAYLSEGDVWDVGNDFFYDYDKQNAHYWHKRYNFRNNLDFNLTKTTKLAINMSGNVKSWGKPQDWFTQEQWFEPVTLMPFYPVEALEQYPDNVTPYDQDQPRPMIEPSQGEVRLHWIGGFGFYRFKANELNNDIRLTQDLDFITKGLSASAMYSYNTSIIYRQAFDLYEYYGYYLDPDTESWTRYTGHGAEDYDTPQNPLVVNNTDEIFQNWRSHYYEFRMNYNRSFGVHNVSGLGVFSRRESGGFSEFPYYEENWVGRGTYNYDSRYFLEGNLAYTGSQKFAPGLRFGLFPAFGGGWVISNEEFFKNMKDKINMLKFRYSYGTVGSDAGVSRWLYVSEYTEGGGATFGYPSQWYGYISEGNIPVTDISWEVAYKQNLGFELGIKENMITVNFDVYQERREGGLMARQSVPSWVGGSDIYANLGETKSHGLELEIGINKYFANGMYFLSNININASENRVVFYDDPEKVPFNIRAAGKPIGASTALVNQGYYQDFDELFMWPVTSGGAPIVGDLKYMDFNGDGSVDAQDYVTTESPNIPLANCNIQLGIGYKNLSLNANIYAISGTLAPTRQGGMFHFFPFTQNKNNAFTAHADHWTPDNPNALFPAVHNQATDQYNYQVSDFTMIQGQYVRLRSVQLQYDLKIPKLEEIGVSQLELSLIGTNLYTWKKAQWGGDPEGFNHGVDFGAYPQMKRVSLEVRAIF